MGILDDLKKAIFETEEFLYGGEIDCRAVSYIAKVFEEFEKLHPNLIDSEKSVSSFQYTDLQKCTCREAPEKFCAAHGYWDAHLNRARRYTNEPYC